MKASNQISYRRAPYGVRELKLPKRAQVLPPGGRAPYGVRELKLPVLGDQFLRQSSRPLRGARIETLYHEKTAGQVARRAPYGVRELKLLVRERLLLIKMSRPLRGARIETSERARNV